ncbi:MAG: transporter suffix domain-containing protein [Oligoflexia bacterium]
MLRLGVALILASFLPWLVLPAVPWLAHGAVNQAKLSGALIALGEVLFWPGLALAGKPAWKTAKAHGWRRMIPALVKILIRGETLKVDNPPDNN